MPLGLQEMVVLLRNKLVVCCVVFAVSAPHCDYPLASPCSSMVDLGLLQEQLSQGFEINSMSHMQFCMAVWLCCSLNF